MPARVEPGPRRGLDGSDDYEQRPGDRAGAQHASGGANEPFRHSGVVLLRNVGWAVTSTSPFGCGTRAVPLIGDVEATRPNRTPASYLALSTVAVSRLSLVILSACLISGSFGATSGSATGFSIRSLPWMKSPWLETKR